MRNSSYHDPDLSIGRYPNRASFGSLNDWIQTSLGYEDVDVSGFNFFVGACPIIFVALCWKYHDESNTWCSRVFTKILCCHSFLAVIKGILVATTIVPDAHGWASCKKRLTEAGLIWFRTKTSALDFLPIDFSDLLTMDYFKHKFCADMMYSRRTYLVVLYGLGIYEIVWVQLKYEKEETISKKRKKILLAVVAAVPFIEQVIEIYYVELARIHYSMDIVVSVVITVLFYTNGPMTIVANRWSRWIQIWKTSKKDTSSVDSYVLVKLEQLKPQGDIIIPPCCIPFCLSTGREHLYSTSQMREIFKYAKKTYTREDIEEIAQEEGLVMSAQMSQKAIAKFRNNVLPSPTCSHKSLTEPLMTGEQNTS